LGGYGLFAHSVCRKKQQKLQQQSSFLPVALSCRFLYVFHCIQLSASIPAAPETRTQTAIILAKEKPEYNNHI